MRKNKPYLPGHMYVDAYAILSSTKSVKGLLLWHLCVVHLSVSDFQAKTCYYFCDIAIIFQIKIRGIFIFWIYRFPKKFHGYINILVAFLFLKHMDLLFIYMGCECSFSWQNLFTFARSYLYPNVFYWWIFLFCLIFCVPLCICFHTSSCLSFTDSSVLLIFRWMFTIILTTSLIIAANFLVLSPFIITRIYIC